MKIDRNSIVNSLALGSLTTSRGGGHLNFKHVSQLLTTSPIISVNVFLKQFAFFNSFGRFCTLACPNCLCSFNTCECFSLHGRSFSHIKTSSISSFSIEDGNISI